MSTAAQARPTREEVAKAAGDAVRNAQVFHGDLRTAGYYGPSNDAAELAAAAERAVLALYPPAADPKEWSSYGDALTASDDGPVPTREQVAMLGDDCRIDGQGHYCPNCDRTFERAFNAGDVDALYSPAAAEGKQP
jgi:hypothetical protein